MGRVRQALSAAALVAIFAPRAVAADPNFTGLVPAGSTITTPNGQTHQLASARFVVTRPQIDAANVLARTEPICQRKLSMLSIDYDRATRNHRDPSWLTAAKWAGRGLAITGAFLLGLNF